MSDNSGDSFITGKEDGEWCGLWNFSWGCIRIALKIKPNEILDLSYDQHVWGLGDFQNPFIIRGF